MIFISCGKRKNAKSCKARDMYTGNYFKHCLMYAETFKTDIYILSAKYGVLDLEQDIYPYDLTLNTMKKEEIVEWQNKVISQLKESNINPEQEVISLCGKNYNSVLEKYFKSVSNPFLNLKNDGMGYRISYMKSRLSRNKKLF